MPVQDYSASAQRGTGRPLPDHPVRVALLDLLAETGTLTATEAANRLGYSSGLCSFHLRQLARHGLVEEVPQQRGRIRPWRLRSRSNPAVGTPPPAFVTLNRELEDESYQRWLSHWEQAPKEWRHDESFSAVVHLTPAELTELAATVRDWLARYQERDRQPTARPVDAAPVAAIMRLFPLLPAAEPTPRSG